MTEPSDPRDYDLELVLQCGHSQPPRTLLFVPGKHLLASTSPDRVLILWDLKAGRQLRLMQGEEYGLTPFPYTEPDTIAAVRATGDVIATAGERTIKLWDVADGSELLSLIEFYGPSKALAFSADGGTLYSLSGTHLEAWAVGHDRSKWVGKHKDFRFRKEFPIGGVKEGSAAEQAGLLRGDVILSIDGHYFETTEEFQYTAGARRVSQFQIRRGRRKLTVPVDKTERGLELYFLFRGKLHTPSALSERELKIDNLYSIEAAAFSHDLQRVAVATAVDGIFIYDTATGDALLELQGVPNSPRVVAFSPADDLVASGHEDGMVKLWDAATGASLREFKIKGKKVQAVAFDPEGRALAVAREGSPVGLWKVGSGRKLRSLKGQMGATALAFDPEGRMLAAADRSHSIQIWDTRRGASVRHLMGQSGDLISSAFSPSGDLLAVGTAKGTVNVFALTHAADCLVLTGLDSPVTAVTFDTLGLFLAAAGIDGRVRLWDTFGWEPLALTDDPPPTIETGHGITSLACAGTMLFAGDGYNKIITIWDVVTGQKIGMLEPQGDDPQISLAGSMSSLPVYYIEARRQFAAGLHYNKIDVLGDPDDPARRPRLFEAVPGATQLGANQHGYDMVQSICASPDGKVLAGGWTKIKLWNFETHEELHTLDGHLHRVQSLAFSPDGRSLASGDRAGVIRLWGVEQGTTLHAVARHTGWVVGLKFLHEGSMLASTELGGEVIFWDAATMSEIARLITYGEDDYVLTTPDNYYFASKGAIVGVAFRVGDRTFPFEQFDLRLNRPDIVLGRLGFASEEMVAAYRAAHRKRLARLTFTEEMLGGETHLPVVSLALEEVPLATAERRLPLRVTAEDVAYKLDRLQVYVNATPLYDTRGLSLRDEQARRVEREVVVELSAGRNKIEVSTWNERGAESLRASVEVTYHGPAPPPTLYVLTVGVSRHSDTRLNLKYAAKDAADLAERLAARAVGFGRVEPHVLRDGEATREAILGARTFLEATRVDDQVVVLFAGHGILDRKFAYYFVPHDFDTARPNATGVSFEQIEGLLDGIPARRKLLLMDTCHSGEIDEDESANDEEETGEKEAATPAEVPGVARAVSDFRHLVPALGGGLLGLENSYRLLRELFTDLRRGSGSVILASAGGMEFAIESDRWSNGVFTFAVLEALNEAEQGRSRLRVSELQDYVVERVQELTGGLQTPVARRENLEFDFLVC